MQSAPPLEVGMEEGGGGIEWYLISSTHLTP